MNALAKIRADLSRATPPLTDRDIGKLGAALHTHYSRGVTAQVLDKPLDFAAEIRATAEQIERDVKSGKLPVTEYGYRTQAELDAAVCIDGGIVWPSHSNGVSK